MQIIDLTNAYKESILQKNNLEEYESSYPILFKHYFEFWAHKPYFSARLDSKQVDEHLDRMHRRLPLIEKKLKEHGFDISKQKIVLFVGQECTNGHAFLDHGEGIVWLPIEAYHSDVQVDVFVTHEILHALHYELAPEFFFSTTEEKYSVARQLLTEGLATFFTMQVLDISEEIALWADYISESERTEWMQECEKKRESLFAYADEEFNRQNHDFFESNDKTDLSRYRAGYWVGLQMIKILSKEAPALSLMEMSYEQMFALGQDLLKQQSVLVEE